MSISDEKSFSLLYEPHITETKFLSVSGVTTDQELANLTQLQSAYAANARVLEAARDMLSTLFGV